MLNEDAAHFKFIGAEGCVPLAHAAINTSKQFDSVLINVTNVTNLVVLQ